MGWVRSYKGTMEEVLQALKNLYLFAVKSLFSKKMCDKYYRIDHFLLMISLNNGVQY